MKNVAITSLVALLAAVVAVGITLQWSAARAPLPRDEPPSTITPPQPQRCTDGTTVETVTGPVCGVIQNGVKTWRGIPYAASPAGANRWQAPKPRAPWREPLEATRAPEPCPQMKGGVSSTNEDCLVVDVSSPVKAHLLPVVVHIHGGGYLGGSNAMYPTDNLAKETDTVVVGVQYRLGALGFLAHDAFGKDAGNYGLLDQQAALRWVQANITEFGGDPNNVTLLGESAGGASTCQLLVSPSSSGLFHKAVVMSAWFNSPTSKEPKLAPSDCAETLPSSAEGHRIAADVAAKVGCTSDIANCLRQAPVDKLVQNQGAIGPIIDGAVLTTQPVHALATGRYNTVPLLLGMDRDENAGPHPQTVEEVQESLDEQFGNTAKDITEHYPIDDYPTPYIAYRTIQADGNTVCRALDQAEEIAEHTDTWMYFGENTDASPSYFDPELPNGAHHVTETSFLFPEGIFAPNENPNQEALSTQVLAAVQAFAYNSDPNAVGAPPWPHVNEGSVTIWRPAGDTVVSDTAVVADEHQCSFWASLDQ